MGKAGCGKSTSVTLIQRFYNASKGSVMLDGKPIGDYDVHHLRRHIGVVAQDNILFSTSIIENITYGMGQGHLPEASMAQVLEACDAANVTEFVKTFPNALYTFIGAPTCPRPSPRTVHTHRCMPQPSPLLPCRRTLAVGFVCADVRLSLHQARRASSSPAGRSSGWPSRGRSSASRPSYCWMRPPRRWTRSTRRRCRRRWTRCCWRTRVLRS